MRKLLRPVSGRQSNNNKKTAVITAIPILFLGTMFAGPLMAADDVVGVAAASTGNNAVQVDQDSQSDPSRVTQLSQAASNADQSTEEILEEVVVTGTQIKGAAISEALSVSVIT